MENVPNGAWGVKRGGWSRCRGDEGGAGSFKDVVGGHRTDTQGGDGDREESARRGSYPDGK